MNNSDAASEERDLRAALQHAVAQICLEEEMTESSSAHMSAQAVTTLSEFVYQYATTCLSNDLAAFSKHANRRTITLEDVLLMTRKDARLQEKLQAFVQRQEGTSKKQKSAKKTTKKANASSPAMTQRMKELQSRLGKGIDSSSDDDDDVQMIDNPFGKENKKQPAKRKSSKAQQDDDDDPFASSDEDQAITAVKPLAKRPFLPGGTKTGLSSDESDDDEMTF